MRRRRRRRRAGLGCPGWAAPACWASCPCRGCARVPVGVVEHRQVGRVRRRQRVNSAGLGDGRPVVRQEARARLEDGDGAHGAGDAEVGDHEKVLRIVARAAVDADVPAVHGQQRRVEGVVAGGRERDRDLGGAAGGDDDRVRVEAQLGPGVDGGVGVAGLDGRGCTWSGSSGGRARTSPPGTPCSRWRRCARRQSAPCRPGSGSPRSGPSWQRLRRRPGSYRRPAARRGPGCPGRSWRRRTRSGAWPWPRSGG